MRTELNEKDNGYTRNSNKERVNARIEAQNRVLIGV